MTVIGTKTLIERQITRGRLPGEYFQRIQIIEHSLRPTKGWLKSARRKIGWTRMKPGSLPRPPLKPGEVYVELRVAYHPISKGPST